MARPLNGPDGSPGGKVIVFRSRVADEHPERYFPPDPWYVAGRDTLVNNFLNAGIEPKIDDPDDISSYFNHLFNKGELDNRGVQDQRRLLDFPKVANLYRLIEDQGRSVVVASWADHQAEVEMRLAAVRDRPTRRNFRRLAPYQVNLRCPNDRQLSFVEEGPHGILIWRGGYQPKTGLWDELLVEQTVL